MDDPTPTPTTRIDSPAQAAPSLGASPPPVDPPPSPGWDQPYRHHHRDRDGRLMGLVGGLVLVGLGLWFFADKTLGIQMPDIEWGQLWPLILIVVGIVVLAGAMRRDRH